MENTDKPKNPWFRIASIWDSLPVLVQYALIVITLSLLVGADIVFFIMSPLLGAAVTTGLLLGLVSIPMLLDRKQTLRNRSRGW